MSHLISSLLVFFAGISRRKKRTLFSSKAESETNKEHLINVKLILFLGLIFCSIINTSVYSQLTFSNTVDVCPPDGNATGTTSVIAVAVTGTSLTSITVNIPNISHTWYDDLDIMLISPTGQRIILMSDCGGDNTGNGNRNYTFIQGGTVLNNNAAPTASGNVSPTQYVAEAAWPDGAPTITAINEFTGNPNGNWTLRVLDDLGGDTGCLIGGWSITIVATTPTTTPSCASTPTPADAATGVSVGTTLSWPAVSGATGYDVFFGISPTPPQVATNQAGTTYNPGALSATTNYFWRVVPINSIGSASGCTTWSFTSGLAGCLNVPNGLWPFETYTPVCNGTPESITTLGYTGEYSNVNLTSGTQYTFSSSVSTDYITISNSAGTAILASGTSPLTWTSNVTGTIRFNLHNNISCATEQVLRTRFIQCGTPLPPPSNDDCAGATSVTCGATVTVITTNANTDAIGSTLCGITITTPGVWYQIAGNGQQMTVSTVSLTTSDTKLIVYSGSCAGLTCVGGSDDFSDFQSQVTWTSVSGTTYYVLAALYTGTGSFPMSLSCVTPPPPPPNDACAGAISLSCGTSGIAGSTLGAVSETAPGSPNVGNLSVWYSFVGDGQQTTISSTAGGTFDHQMVIYTGSSCSNFCIIGNQDVGFGGGTETFTFTTTSGQQYYVYIADWITGSTTSGTFNISQSCSTPPAAPANNNCIDAQSITVQCPGATSISGTTLNATSESSIANPSCDNCGIINDVWYTFNSGPNTSVNLTVTLGTASWLGGEVYTTCGSLATGLTIGGNVGNCDFNLSTPSPTVISGLTTNTTYILRLYTNDTYNTPGTFSFTLTNSVNNPGAVSVPASICAGTATSITNVTAATGAPGSVNYYFYYRGGPSNVGWQMYDGPTTNTSSSLPSAVINTPGTWFIARNSDFGCGQTNNATTVDLQLIVNSSPTVSLNCPDFCAGIPIDITATPTPAGTYTYNWTSLPGGVIDPVNNAIVNTTTVGTYEVIATNTATGCQSAATSCPITVSSPPSIIFLSPP